MEKPFILVQSYHFLCFKGIIFSSVLNFLLIFSCNISDTEGSFIVERVLDIATAAIRHITNVVQSSDADETGTEALHFL